MGHIIATAAVFEIHMEMNMATAVKPKFNLLKRKINQEFAFRTSPYSHRLCEQPMMRITLRATRL
jgi:hypothetical protein